MDERRFDTLTKYLGKGSSRRLLVKEIAGGGLAALLATVGFGAAGAADVSAASCRSQCKKEKTRKKRRRCLRGCPTVVDGTPVGVGPSPIGFGCASHDTCATGYCDPVVPRKCWVCPTPCTTAQGNVCCPPGATCSNQQCIA